MKANRTVQFLMGEFDTYLRVERNLAAGTREGYRYDLNNFRAFLMGKKSKVEPVVDGVSAQLIKDYLAHLQGVKNYKSTTLSRVIASIRVFFEYCVQQQILEISPAAYIHNPKLPRKLPVYLIESELKALLKEPDPDDAIAVRDFAILVCLAFTGMRRQELVGLNLNSIDIERRTVRVFGKGSKERLIPLNPIVMDALNNHLTLRCCTGDHEAVFLNKRGGRLTGRSVFNIVKKYVQLAGVGKQKISPHKLRHTFATLLHMNEVDILEIQRLLGHASITSTQVYTHTNPGKLRAAVDTLNYVLRPGAK